MSVNQYALLVFFCFFAFLGLPCSICRSLADLEYETKEFLADEKITTSAVIVLCVCVFVAVSHDNYTVHRQRNYSLQQKKVHDMNNIEIMNK